MCLRWALERGCVISAWSSGLGSLVSKHGKISVNRYVYMGNIYICYMMLYVISGVDPNLDKFGWYDENISSKMVPNIDPKNSNVFFFQTSTKNRILDLGSNKTAVGWYGFQWDLIFGWCRVEKDCWKIIQILGKPEININTRAENFPRIGNFVRGELPIKLKGRDIGSMWFFGKHFIKSGIVPSLFPNKKQLWSGVSFHVGQYQKTRASFLLTPWNVWFGRLSNCYSSI